MSPMTATWTVPEKLLVCGFRIKLLSLYELVVEVNVIPLAPLSAALWTIGN